MIKVLSKKVSDKIAAGEVIDRPVSIVKELTENAVDAGAENITVEIRNGGKTFIRVTDDGCGIEPEETETAFLRHATSKISRAEDLDAVESLGFRGEALASIAAVTRTTLVTKPGDRKTGCRLVIHGGTVIEKSAVGCPDGTTMVVTDLFYNTPARREFLKSDGAESTRIIDLVSELSVVYPGIRFQMINNGRTIFTTSGNGSMKQAVLAVYQLSEYRDLVEVDREAEGFRVTGCISRPSLNRPNRRNQYYYVNGRVVDSRVMEKGVTQGYRERLFEGRFPVVFLHLRTNPGTVDVNIHPNKKEVRFHDDKPVIRVISEAVRQALATDDAVIQASDYFRRQDKKTSEGVQEEADLRTLLASRREQTEQRMFVREERSGSEASDVPDLSGRRSSRKGPAEPKPDLRPDPAEQDLYRRIPDALREDAARRQEQRRGDSPECRPEGAASRPGSPEHRPEGPESRRKSPEPQPAAPAWKNIHDFDLEPEKRHPFSFDDLTITGCIFDTYITCVDENSFYMIDQHAAHERVFYERLVGEYLDSEKPGQQLLLPLILEAPVDLESSEYDWLEPLREMGYRIEPFGPRVYRIDTIPTFMSMTEAEGFVKEFMVSLDENETPRNTVVIDKLITKSCKSAVKAHDTLSGPEREALLEQLKRCRNPFSCPHGRPTFIRFTKYEIEKFFKRVQ